MEGHQRMNSALRGLGPKGHIVTQDHQNHPHQFDAPDMSEEAVAARSEEYPRVVEGVTYATKEAYENAQKAS